MLVCATADDALAWQMCLGRVSTALRNWNRVRAAPAVAVSGIARVGMIAAQATGWRFGCESGGGVM